MRCDLRQSSTRRLDLRSASDARDTKATFVAHENARFAGFTKSTKSPRGAYVSAHDSEPVASHEQYITNKNGNLEGIS